MTEETTQKTRAFRPLRIGDPCGICGTAQIVIGRVIPAAGQPSNVICPQCSFGEIMDKRREIALLRARLDRVHGVVSAASAEGADSVKIVDLHRALR